MAQRRSRKRGAKGRLGLMPSRAVAIAAIALAVLLLGAGAIAMTAGKGVVVERGPRGQGSAQTETGPSTPATQVVVVDVDGAVASPGVYDLPGDAPRVRDAIAAAGGLTPEADTSTLNMAALVVDASKVHVPSAGEQQPPSSADKSTESGSSSAPAAGGGAASKGLVNINTATAEELTTLSGVGEATANAIVKDREANGPFSSVEDIMRVSGIGQKKFAKIQGSICV